jgi:hypothetical protein
MVDIVDLYQYAELPDPEKEKYRAIPVNFSHILTHWAMFRRDPSLFASLRTLKRYVLGQGMRVTKQRVKKRKKARRENSSGNIPEDDEKENEPYLIAEEHQFLFDNQWIRFFTDVLYFCSVFGFAVVDKRPAAQRHEGSVGIPFARNPLELDITELRYRDGRRLWWILHRTSDVVQANSILPNRDASFITSRLRQGKDVRGSHSPSDDQVLRSGFVVLMSDLDPNGDLNTEISRIIPSVQLARHAVECAARGWNRNSAPAMILQQQARAKGNENVSGAVCSDRVHCLRPTLHFETAGSRHHASE